MISPATITASDIEELFGSMLSLITAADLKTKVVDTFIDACQQGGWHSANQLKEMPFTLLTDTHGISFVEHNLAVTAGAVSLAKAMDEHYHYQPTPVDMDYLVAGALLHDVGKLTEIEQSGANYQKSHAGRCARHPISGAILAAAHGLPDEIINMIACHSREGDGRPQRVETILIHQADFATFNPLVMLNNGNLIAQDEQ